MVEALYNMHRTFLSLPKRQATATEFIALVTGHRNVLDESRSNRGNGHILTSEDAKNRGEAALQKVHEEPPPDDSCPEGAIPGFSLSFKKRYYGELASNIQTRVVGSRTLRLPVTVPADRGATPENRDTISSAKHIDDAINKDSTNFTVNESSPDGSSVVLEATEAAQAETFLETKGTADAVICPTQQHLKKRRIEHNMDGCMISKSEHDTMVAGKEGNKSVGVLNQQQILGQFISADDMLVLDVLQSLVNTRDSGTPERGEAALSHRKDDGHPLLDQSKQGKPVGECNTSKTCHNKHEMLLGEVPSEETNIAHAIDITEGSSSNSESAKGTRDLLQSTASSPSEVCPYAPRETKPERSMSRRSKVKSKMNRKNQHMSCNRISDSLQARKLLHCLSSESLRRWCTYDWFYSAIDFPWFTNNEFVKYLNHLNVSHLSRLARSEWIAIRSPLGKHRRFSDHFLVTEKENLKEYREEVRKYYAQLSAGLLDFLPSDLALPFSIGQQVIVRHPRSRELCDGKVVMVKPGCCKVQFDNPKLGVELVKVEYSAGSQRPPKKSTFDDTVRSRGWQSNSVGYHDELESYITAFVQSSQSQARQMVDEVMQEISGGNDYQDEEAGTWNQATCLIVPEAENGARGALLDLILNCTATFLAVKRLTDSRHPPANIAGVLERLSSMLRPSCSENLAIYKEIEILISIIKSKTIALVPTTSGNGCCPMYLDS